ncbi:MAG: PilZ domain-containing protein [Pseudomonadales bacterium]|nr:PilZ domain-containing protein [Pseudomonadales bacterium]MCP5215228.1 PilZ domain-containing protein [Pseudomonadales bacterium]
MNECTLYSGAQDRRKYRRVRCSLPVVLTAGPNKFWYGTSINISEYGLLIKPIEATHQFRVHDKLHILIEGILCDQALSEDQPGHHLSVRVVFSKAWGIGLKFI